MPRAARADRGFTAAARGKDPSSLVASELPQGFLFSFRYLICSHVSLFSLLRLFASCSWAAVLPFARVASFLHFRMVVRGAWRFEGCMFLRGGGARAGGLGRKSLVGALVSPSASPWAFFRSFQPPCRRPAFWRRGRPSDQRRAVSERPDSPPSPRSDQGWRENDRCSEAAGQVLRGNAVQPRRPRAGGPRGRRLG